MFKNLIKHLKGSLLAAILGLTIFGASSSPVYGQWVVVDPSHIAQSVTNTGLQIAKWTAYIQQFKQYYSTFNAAYMGMKNWNNMGWVDMLQLSELPYFDNMQGIEDIRNITGSTELSIDDLQNIYGDAKWFNRMQNDPTFAKSAALRERHRAMLKLSQRSMRRKMVITRMMKRVQKENDKLMNQSKTAQALIEQYSKQDPAPVAAIQGLQAKISVNQSKMQANNDSVAAQLTNMEQQQDAELVQMQSELQCNMDDLRKANTAMKGYWGKYFEFNGGGI